MPRIPVKLFKKILVHFKGDLQKSRLWFSISNPILNGIKPIDYHQGGNYSLLEHKIDKALEDYANAEKLSSAESDKPDTGV